MCLSVKVSKCSAVESHHLVQLKWFYLQNKQLQNWEYIMHCLALSVGTGIYCFISKELISTSCKCFLLNITCIRSFCCNCMIPTGVVLELDFWTSLLQKLYLFTIISQQMIMPWWVEYKFVYKKASSAPICIKYKSKPCKNFWCWTDSKKHFKYG